VLQKHIALFNVWGGITPPHGSLNETGKDGKQTTHSADLERRTPMIDESYEREEGLVDLQILGIFLVDASRTMRGTELKSGKPKYQRAMWMIQEVHNRLDDPQYQEAAITLAYFSAVGQDVKIVTILDDYNPYDLKTYTGNTDLTIWDPFSPANLAQGLCNLTPIGSGLAWGFKQAAAWVTAAPGQLQRRCIIFVLSDGMNNVGPDGRQEKQAIEAFNATCEKGQIRVATIGYFQSAPGTDQEDQEQAEGRKLLKDLVLNEDAYFESDDIEKILRYILGTFTQAMHPATV
jgi:hypothetical protein